MRGRIAADPILDPLSAYDRGMDNADSHPVADVPEDYDTVGEVRPSSPDGGNENEGPANPSDEAEDRNKSPQGGRPVEDEFDIDDDEVAVDPEGAMTANGFISLITVVMLILVVLVVVTALTGSTIMLIVTFLGIMAGLGLVLKNLFEMMSTD